MKRNDGFTLIELLVTISAGALVTFAAVSLLLLGARVQYRTTQEANDQQTVRVATALLEEMAGSGAFNAIETTYDGWRLLNITKTVSDGEETEQKDVVFEYITAQQTLYRGEYHPEGEGNEPVLTGLNNAGIALEGNLVRLSFGTEQGAGYATRVYCRTADVSDAKDNSVKDAEELSAEGKNEIPEAPNRIEFLDKLAGEYNGGNNTGKSPTTGEYYSHWYIGAENWGTNGWNKDTPWCACFVSWAAVNMEGSTIGKDSPFVFANVDTGMAAFKNPSNGGTWKTADPKPGDYIFFDWTGDKKDPAHVGAVLDTQGNDIYTIEGNSSGRVAVRKYHINDPVIMGYGVLPGF